MTTTVATTDPRPDVDRHHRVARNIAKIVMLILTAFGIWCSMHLLSWAVDKHQRSVVATATADVTMEMRERQLGCLTANIYHEAGGEPFEGKVAVAQVTLNRAEVGGFPGDICKVIYQKNLVYNKVLCQFSWVCERSTNIKPVNKVEYNEAQAVAKKVLLEGFRLPSLKDALYFHGDYINPGWRREKIAHIGHHIFYR